MSVVFAGEAIRRRLLDDHTSSSSSERVLLDIVSPEDVCQENTMFEYSVCGSKAVARRMFSVTLTCLGSASDFYL